MIEKFRIRSMVLAGAADARAAHYSLRPAASWPPKHALAALRREAAGAQRMGVPRHAGSPSLGLSSHIPVLGRSRDTHSLRAGSSVGLASHASPTKTPRRVAAGRS